MSGEGSKRERDAYPIWAAMGAAFVGTLLGGAAVWLGLAGRPAKPSSDSAAGDPLSLDASADTDAEPDASAGDRTADRRAGRGDAGEGAALEASDPGDSPLVRAIAATRDSVVSIEFAGGVRGAGVVYDEQGVLLSNYHVIEPVLRAQAVLGPEAADAQVTARFADGRARAARVIAADPDEDVAVLQLERQLRGEQPERFAAASVGESSRLRLGEQVFAIGSPVGFEATVATGIVSALERTQVLANRQLPVIQLDAAINFGNSGGPLFNLRGELVGITTARSSRGEGIGFAIPIDRIRLFLQALEDGTRGRSGMIGVSLDLRAEIAEIIAPLGFHSGVRVDEVTPGRPAQRAGLEPGDVIVAIRGRRYDDLDADLGGRIDFARIFGESIRGLLPGEVIAISVVRQGELGLPTLHELELRVEAASVDEQARIDAEELLGLRLEPSEEGGAPVIAGLVPGAPITRWPGVAALEGATIVSILQRPVAALPALGEQLALLREWTASGGRRSIAIAFRTAKGELLSTSAYPVTRR
ncbi:trypsin-like peptidase domain-containing protein [Pseudenhygromyxa sp. WMMC2535]|uniref:S1C family serine protease n=1 Tax=Pseudenhygromyxa sp. WMMC2535 TaxID=2712867 RepID=UPI00155664E0|nr:trypsin-like peptidase domain-containing protein [Pseudenhygromyxa sp. WMMC2535]NVB41756.1 trypsin-like peptidase domain-containing protein [Pseudenhygromyxa sp. WMMC2535]